MIKIPIPVSLTNENAGLVSPYLRTVETTSGATAVQIVHSSRRGSRDIDHLGSDSSGTGMLRTRTVSPGRLHQALGAVS